MGWFGDLDLGLKYAIVLGCLIALVFIAGFIKLFIIRQRTRRYQEEAKAKAANEEGKVEQIALNQREEGEGDLFGIRALERGFYGGVAQSRPTTPTPGNMSSSTLVPSAANIPFGQKTVGSTAANSATSSVITIDVGNPKSPTNQTAKRNDVAVDMGLTVPDSPKLPRSPESPRFPRERSPSPLSHSLPQLESNIPSSGLGLSSYSASSGAPKIQSKTPVSPVQVNAPRGMTLFSSQGSVHDEDEHISPPGSPSQSSHHNSGSQSGPSTNFSRQPPSPPRNTYKPQIKIDAPRPDSPTAAAAAAAAEREISLSAMSRGRIGRSSEDGGEGGYGAQLGVNVGVVNRASSQSLAEVYDSYYDGTKRMSNVRESTYSDISITSSAYEEVLERESDQRYPRMAM